MLPGWDVEEMVVEGQKVVEWATFISLVRRSANYWAFSQVSTRANINLPAGASVLAESGLETVN